MARPRNFQYLLHLMHAFLLSLRIEFCDSFGFGYNGGALSEMPLPSNRSSCLPIQSARSMCHPWKFTLPPNSERGRSCTCLFVAGGDGVNNENSTNEESGSKVSFSKNSQTNLPNASSVNEGSQAINSNGDQGHDSSVNGVNGSSKDNRKRKSRNVFSGQVNGNGNGNNRNKSSSIVEKREIQSKGDLTTKTDASIVTHGANRTKNELQNDLEQSEGKENVMQQNMQQKREQTNKIDALTNNIQTNGAPANTGNDLQTSVKSNQTNETKFLPPPMKTPLLTIPPLSSFTSGRRRRKLVDRSTVFNVESSPSVLRPTQFSSSVHASTANGDKTATNNGAAAVASGSSSSNLVNGSKPLPTTSTSKGATQPTNVQTTQTPILPLVEETADTATIPFVEQEEEELCYLDDLPGTTAGQTCFVSHSSSPIGSSYSYTNSPSKNPLLSLVQGVLPLSSKSSSISSDSISTEVSPSIATEEISSDFVTESDLIDFVMKYIPIITPLFAFISYEPTAALFDRTVEFLSNNNWIAVDGGQYQTQIITPAINGLVVPSMALLFATLMSNTINTLRARQLQIRTNLNIEANDLRMLSTIVDSLPADLRTTKNHLREYLIQYASRVIAESKPGLSVDHQMFVGSMDSEMNGFLGVWNKLSMCSYGTMYVDTMLPPQTQQPNPTRSSGQNIEGSMQQSTNNEENPSSTSPPISIPDSAFGQYQTQLSLSTPQRHVTSAFLSPPIFSEAYDALTRLRSERSTRLSALQSTYPTLHYVILGLLASSICTVFLMETNQELLIFLSAIQLKILWSMLIGTFTALGVVNYDMIDPFRGSYNVAVSVDQFYTIREAIRATIQMDQDPDENDAGSVS